MTLFYVFFVIALLFFILLGIKQMLNKKIQKDFCVICLSVSLTWIVLLFLSWINLFDDKILLALLIGQSSLGIFYLWEKRAAEKYLVFRLPLLLTLIVIAYTLISGFSYGYEVFALLIVLWAIFILIFLYGHNEKIGKLMKKLVECCKKW